MIVIKIILIIIGTMSLVFGILGIFLPVLPTTPFILLALACYLKSSQKLYDLVVSNKYLGPYVKNYISNNGVPLKAKKKAIFLVWITIGFSVLFIIHNVFIKGILLIIASSVSAYIWTRKTFEEKETIDCSVKNSD